MYISNYKKILVTGSTGVIGKELTLSLKKSGYIIAGLSNSKDFGANPEYEGIVNYTGDITDSSFVNRIISEFTPDVVIHQVTGLKNMSSIDNASVRAKGTVNLIESCKKFNVKKVIAQSIAWAYAPGSQPAVETDALDLLAGNMRKVTIDGILALENAVKDMDDFVILRYGTLYGKETWYDIGGNIYDKFRSFNAEVSDGIISFVHLQDAVNAAMHSLSWPKGIYNVVDNNPVKGEQWGKYYSELLNVENAFTVKAGALWERGASNKKLKSVGYSLIYPSWTDGMVYLKGNR